MSLRSIQRLPAYARAFLRGDLLIRQDVAGFTVPTQPVTRERMIQLVQPLCSTIITLDRVYSLCSVSDARRIVAWDKTNAAGFRREVGDCDDYVRGLFRNAPAYFGVTGFGLVIDYDAKHAFNIVVCAGEELLYLEPQTDEWRSAARIGWGAIII